MAPGLERGAALQRCSADPGPSHIPFRNRDKAYGFGFVDAPSPSARCISTLSSQRSNL
jgi:hypothetical protein